MWIKHGHLRQVFQTAYAVINQAEKPELITELTEKNL